MSEPFTDEERKRIKNNHGVAGGASDDCMICRYEATIAELKSEIESQDKLNELFWPKYRTLEKMWQKDTGNPKTWPDRGKLLDWLKSELEAKNKRIEEMEVAIKISGVDKLYGNGICDPVIAEANKLFSDEVVTLQSRLERMEGALETIAAFNDEFANMRLEKTGSYGGFDEPGSVSTARQALKKKP